MINVNDEFGQDEDGKPEAPHPPSPSPTGGEGVELTEFEYCPKCHSGNTTCMFEQEVTKEDDNGVLYEAGAWGAFKCLDCDYRWWER